MYVNNSFYKLSKVPQEKWYENNLDSINGVRNNLYSYSLEDILETGLVYDANNLPVLPEGRFALKYEDIEFDCYYRKKDSSKLYVVLNGGITYDFINERPVFQRWKYSNFIDGTMLNITDPMFKLDASRKLEVGWYYGTKDVSYISYVIEIVKLFASKFNYKNEDIVFFGSSAGGYASLYCGCLLEGSSAVAINPQLSILKHSNSKELMEVLGVDSLEPFNLNSRNDISELISKNTKSKLIVVENLRAKGDINQFNLLLNRTGEKINYGLNILKNVIMWTYDADMAPYHTSQETRSLYFVIEYLLNLSPSELSEKKYEFLMFSELWHEIYEEKKKIEASRSKYIKLVSSSQSEKILFENDVVVPALNDINNSTKINLSLKSNTTYKLSFNEAFVLEGEFSTFDVSIISGYSRYFDHTFSLKDSGFVYFKTSDAINNVVLLIAPGKTCERQGKGLKLLNLRLEEKCNSMHVDVDVSLINNHFQDFEQRLYDDNCKTSKYKKILQKLMPASLFKINRSNYHIIRQITKQMNYNDTVLLEQISALQKRFDELEMK